MGDELAGMKTKSISYRRLKKGGRDLENRTIVRRGFPTLRNTFHIKDNPLALKLNQLHQKGLNPRSVHQVCSLLMIRPGY